MILLAMDTSTSAITVAVHDGSRLLAERAVIDARAHTEHLAPLIVETLAEAGIGPEDVTAVAVGVGPGPFTGLRVGLVTAKTFAYARGIPCHGVVSLDVLAHAAVSGGFLDEATEFIVTTDARRKEVYLARYSVGDGRAHRETDPEVIRPADIPEDLRALPAVGRGPLLYPEILTNPVDVLDASAGALAEVALQQLADGVEVGLDALYLRRPDAQPSVAPKSTIMAPRDEQR
ncbi:MAG: tRNA (adenosine(37)-N6)-threonylcarbamoyltransferase complex dimerization subunit type 1 TsaB [Actinomycetia bacterium]|nr:tRNA (adenosine(37)-N6)-threonylcarbamoyltransferase complex dimerization subunit type 1 TsaB [Actinomycetes bacterium]